MAFTVFLQILDTIRYISTAREDPDEIGLDHGFAWYKDLFFVVLPIWYDMIQ